MSLVKLLTTVVAAAVLISVPQVVSARPSPSPGSVAIGRRPAIAAGSQGLLHVAFEEGKEGQRHIYYCQSSNQGKAWTKPLDISPDQSLAQFVHIAVDKSESIDAVWRGIREGASAENAEFYFARSSDGGKTFTTARALFKSACKDSGPSIAVAADGTVHLLWCDASTASSERKIFYSRSGDNGLTWSDKQLVVLENQKEVAGLSSPPTLAVSDDGIVHAAWLDVDPGKSEPGIFYAKCENGKWTQSKNISRSAHTAQQPVIACGRQQKVFLTWVDNSRKELTQDIWSSVDSHEGSFAPPFNISDTPGVSSDPAIITDKRGRLVIVWSDTTSGSSYPDIFGRVSYDSLADFSKLINFSNTDGRSKWPSAAITGDRLFVVWEEAEGALSLVLFNYISLTGVGTSPTPRVDK